MTDPTATNQALVGGVEGAAQPGTILAVIAWALASVGFSFYLSNFANYGVIYVSLGTAIALLVYLYLSALALLLSKEVNAAIYGGATDSEMQSQRHRIDRETLRAENRGGPEDESEASKGSAPEV